MGGTGGPQVAVSCLFHRVTLSRSRRGRNVVVDVDTLWAAVPRFSYFCVLYFLAFFPLLLYTATLSHGHTDLGIEQGEKGIGKRCSV